MKREVIIFVVFASFAISSVVPSTPAKHGLSEEERASLSNIADKENTTLVAKYEAVNPLFDVLQQLAAQSIFNLPATTEDPSPIVAKALSKAKDATDYSLDAIPIAAGKSCPAIDTARVALHGILDHIYVLLPSAIASAQSAQSSDNRTGIEILQAAVHTDCVTFVEKIYDSIRICLNTTDNDTLAVLKSAQEKSGDAFLHTLDAIFNAIKVYGAAVSAEHQNIHFLADIEYFRGRALFGLRSDVEHKFSALKSIFIYRHLNQTGSLPKLAAAQYARTVAHNKAHKGTGMVYDSIIKDLTKINLGLSPDMDDDFSRDDATKAEVIATFNSMVSHVLESFQFIKPMNSSAVAATEKVLFNLNDQLITAYYNAMDLAMDQSKSYSEALNEIEKELQNVPSNSEYFATAIFNLTRNDPSWDADTAAKIATFQRRTTLATKVFIKSIFDSTTILARAARKIGTPNEDYLAEILANKNKASPAVVSFADDISSTHVTTFVASGLSLRLNVGIGLSSGLSLNLGILG